jgi:hypothetical protein
MEKICAKVEKLIKNPRISKKYPGSLHEKILGKFKGSHVGKLTKEIMRSKATGTLSFNDHKGGDAPANVFLLTHKCGNNYVASVFRQSNRKLTQLQTDELKGQMPGPYIGENKSIGDEFANIRCRNFTPLSIEKLLRSVDLQKTQFFLFVRHPASLFRSAVSYHMRGNEIWARTSKYSYLNYRTLSQALNEAEGLETRLIISMTHFGNLWRLTDNWLNCYQYLTNLGANLTVVKTEELFVDGDEDYFESLAEKMTHNGFAMSSEQLKVASPKYMENLPSHSTGEFKKDPLYGYTGKALEMYNRNFLECQKFFYLD